MNTTDDVQDEQNTDIRSIIDELLVEHYKDNDRITVIDFHDDCAVVYIDINENNQDNQVMQTYDSIEFFGIHDMIDEIDKKLELPL